MRYMKYVLVLALSLNFLTAQSVWGQVVDEDGNIVQGPAQSENEQAAGTEAQDLEGEIQGVLNMIRNIDTNYGEQYFESSDEYCNEEAIKERMKPFFLDWLEPLPVHSPLLTDPPPPPSPEERDWDTQYNNQIHAEAKKRRLSCLRSQLLIYKSSTFNVTGRLRATNTSNESNLRLIESADIEAICADEASAVSADPASDEYQAAFGACIENARQNNIMQRIIKLITQLIGTLGVLLMMAGGIMMITSDGDENRLQSGKNMIIYTILGLLLAFLSYALVQLVLSMLFSAA